MVAGYKQWPSDSGTKLILLEGSDFFKERVSRIEVSISHKLPQTAVKLGRSGLADHVDDAT